MGVRINIVLFDRGIGVDWKVCGGGGGFKGTGKWGQVFQVNWKEGVGEQTL